MRLTLILTALLTWPHSLVHAASAASQPKLLTQFPPSVRIENLTILPNGTVVVCNAYTGDLYSINHLHGPSGAVPHRFASFAPYSSAVFGLASPSPHTIVATASNFSWDQGLVEQGSNAVQHVTLTKTGVKTKAFPIPSAGWLNGLTPVPRSPHYLLVADCVAGSLLRLDTRTGSVKTVISDPLFAPVPEPGSNLLLGINGVHALGGWLYFTNTNQGLYGRIAITHDGLAVGTPAEVIARGLNGSTFDDFALRRDGVAFLATGLGGPNGIEKITAAGKGRLVASWEYGSPDISQPVSAVFGRTKRDQGILYFATAGSYLGPNPKSTGGQLFSLKVEC
ncbi:quinoprotein amine dehydrogenase beta chain-like protein [Ilyonectria robusta]